MSHKNDARLIWVSLSFNALIVPNLCPFFLLLILAPRYTLGNCMSLLSSAYFSFKIIVLKKYISGIGPECQTLWMQIMPNIFVPVLASGCSLSLSAKQL